MHRLRRARKDRLISKSDVGLKYGFRSGLEERVAGELKALGIPVLFEEVKIKFEQPSKLRTYTADFLLPNGIYIETKGRLTSEDRKKHLWIKAQHPEIDLRFVFSNPQSRIAKGSNTRYCDWCTKNNFKFSRGSIPLSWIKE
jgi:hypothetical protein